MSTKLERRYEAAKKTLARGRSKVRAQKAALLGDAAAITAAVAAGAADGYLGGEDRQITIEAIPVTPIVGGIGAVAGIALGGAAGHYVGRAGVGALCYSLGSLTRDALADMAAAG